MTNSADQLSNEEREIVRQCLDATVNGPFFPDWEFALLFGLTRAEVAAVLSSWPENDDPVVQDLAVTNAMNNLVGYPIDDPESWPQYVHTTRETVEELKTKWVRITASDSATRR